MNDKLFAALCQAMGRPERADQLQYRTNAGRMSNHEASKAELEVALARQPVASSPTHAELWMGGTEEPRVAPVPQAGCTDTTLELRL